jgi:hypothetical protein
MTEHAQGGHPPAEADRINSWKIAAVGLASLAVFLVASLLTVAWMRKEQAELNPAFPVMPAEAGQAKIGIVEQQLFESANHAEAVRRRQLDRLGSYGWVDKEKGLVHVPIDAAMERYLAGERP